MKKNWYWLIPIIVAFIVGYFLRGVGPVGLAQTTPTGYDIFRDLLSIFLALLVGTGTLLYLVIRREVTEKVREDITTEFSKMQGRLHLDMGVMYYYQQNYEKAIQSTKYALTFEKNLEELDKIYAKSNLAFYYAARHKGFYEPPEVPPRAYPQWENKGEAIKLAKLGYDKYDPLVGKFNIPDWVDNYAFVRAVFAQTSQEKQEVRDFINNLLRRRDLQIIRSYLQKDMELI